LPDTRHIRDWIAFPGYSLYFASPMKRNLTVAGGSIQYQTPVAGSFHFCIHYNLLHRVVVLLLFINGWLLPASAQTAKSYKSEDFDVHHFRVKKISIAIPENTVDIRNMCGITVMDVRADTSVVGFMQKKIVDPLSGIFNGAEKSQTEQRVNKRPIFISLAGGLQQEAAQFGIHAISFSRDTKLPDVLMVVRKLWLSDELNFSDQGYSNNRFAGPANHDVWTSGIDVKIEFYLHDGSCYYPMYRYDSIISKALTISEYGPEYIALALQLSMQRLSQMDATISSVGNRTKFTLTDIMRHNQQEFELPVLRDDALVKGVYMSFGEFKNNQPSQTRFELKKERLTDIIYIKRPNGTDDMTRNVWGYCDGKNAYIKSGDNFFLLQRNANAFYIFGAKTFKREEPTYQTNTYNNSGGYAAPVYYTNTRVALQLEPFQLDWSNGKLY
jgi:hypothetical protein